MDTTLWFRFLHLKYRDRARWTRSYLEHGTIPGDLLAAVRPYRSQAARWLEATRSECTRSSIEIVTPLDASYPRAALGRLHDPPGVLFVRGDLSLLQERPAVAVVGARRGTARGRRVAGRIGEELGMAGLAVVSGLALGIDAAAHEGCLRSSGRPIAVLANGLDHFYPARNETLGQLVAEAGVVVSEHPPGHGARRYDFVSRNRIIAALASALVVVEAGDRSGALSTVEFAQQVGAEVMVVPGPVDCPHSQGTLSLLRDGATLVRDAMDVLDSLGLSAPPRPDGPFGLGSTPQSAAEVARRNRWSIAEALAALGEAEILGQVERIGVDRWAVRAGSGLPPSPGRD